MTLFKQIDKMNVLIIIYKLGSCYF